MVAGSSIHRWRLTNDWTGRKSEWRALVEGNGIVEVGAGELENRRGLRCLRQEEQQQQQ